MQSDDGLRYLTPMELPSTVSDFLIKKRSRLSRSFFFFFHSTPFKDKVLLFSAVHSLVLFSPILPPYVSLLYPHPPSLQFFSLGALFYSLYLSDIHYASFRI